MTESAMNPLNRLRAIREAGAVKRYHQVPLIGGENTVAAHSWHVALLVLQMSPNPSRGLLVAALTHDLGERWAGDIPAPVKWRLDREKLEEFERDVRTSLGFPDPDLSEEEQWMLKGCDMLECYLFATEQVEGFGNKHAQQVARNALKWIEENKEQVPLSIVVAAQTYQYEREDENYGTA